MNWKTKQARKAAAQEKRAEESRLRILELLDPANAMSDAAWAWEPRKMTGPICSDGCC